MRRRSINFQLVLAYFIFLALAIIVPGGGESAVITIVLSVATFTFAILLAFSISSRHSRLGAIRGSLRKNDALLINIYTLSSVFGKKVQKQVQRKIDEYLMIQLDYFLDDFDKTTPKLLELYDYLLNLKPKNNSQSTAYAMMYYDMKDLIVNEKECLLYLRDKMMLFEWISLVILSFVVWSCLLFLNDGSWFVILVIPFLSITFLLMLGILKDLNSLKWQEQRWIWEPLAILFTDLGLLPYYPEELFTEGRLREVDVEGTSYRLATYTKPYPDFRGKKIQVLKVKKK